MIITTVYPNTCKCGEWKVSSDEYCDECSDSIFSLIKEERKAKWIASRHELFSDIYITHFAPFLRVPEKEGADNEGCGKDGGSGATSPH